MVKNRGRLQTWKQEYGKLLAVLSVFTVLQAVILALRWDRALVWDSTVYIGMGKHLYTLGEIGLYESFRPPIIPLLIGAIWKTGLFFPNLARITAVIISATGLTVFYSMVRAEFKQKTALYASAILASSFIYLRWSHYLLTGIPSAILAFTAIYYARNQKPVISGLAASLAFLTRFPAALAAPAAGITYILTRVPLKDVMNLRFDTDDFVQVAGEGLKMAVSFSVLPVIYFSLNYFYGNSFLSPLLSGASVPLLNPDKYLYGLYFLKEAVITNPLMIFALPGIYFVLRKKEEKAYGYVTGLALFYTFFTVYPHKEPRFMILFLPVLSLFAGIGLQRLELPAFEDVLDGFTVSRGSLVLLAAGAVMLVNGVQLVQMNTWSNPERNDFLRETSKLNGTVAGLHPAPVVYGNFDFIAVRPEHYENTTERAFRQADYFVYNSAAWYCAPAIQNCREKQDQLVERLEQHNKIFETSRSKQSYRIYEVGKIK
ncbi:MAG: glycosyltransferase family 39 protein [Candidatus Nanohalobium sp.]